MKFLLITWVLYKSTFMQVGYSALDIQQFDSIEECESAKDLVMGTLEEKRFDEISVECKQM